MADIERQLIAKVVDSQGMRKAIDQQVTSKLFAADDRNRLMEGGQVWDWVMEFFREFGSTPTRDALAKRWPTYLKGVDSTQEPLLYWVKELRKKRVHTVLHKGMAGMAAAMKAKDPYEAADLSGRGGLEEGARWPLRDVNQDYGQGSDG